MTYQEIGRPYQKDPEELIIRPEFSNEEKKKLGDDGAEIFSLVVETLQSQIETGKPFWFMASAEQGVAFRELPSRIMNVAIYPPISKFFIQESFNTSKTSRALQEDCLQRDTKVLRERLGLRNIGEILPRVSEATQVLFRYFDKTGKRILDRKDFIMMRTSTWLDRASSVVASVGLWHQEEGLSVLDWEPRCGYPDFGVARWIVPLEDRK